MYDGNTGWYHCFSYKYVCVATNKQTQDTTKIASKKNTIAYENHNYNVNIPVVSCQYHRLGLHA